MKGVSYFAKNDILPRTNSQQTSRATRLKHQFLHTLLKIKYKACKCFGYLPLSLHYTKYRYNQQETVRTRVKNITGTSRDEQLRIIL